MNLLESINIGFKSLTGNKLRTGLTLIGITLGNASVITMVAIGQGASQFMQQQLESLGPNQLTVFADNTNSQGAMTEKAELVLADAEAIASQAPAVREVAPQINRNFQLSRQKSLIQADVIGTTKGILYVRNLKVDRGRFFENFEQQENARVVVLGASVARQLFGRENPLGKSLEINNLTFKVIGTMEVKGAFMGVKYDEKVYVPITTMANHLTGAQSPHGITINLIEFSAKDRQNIRAAAFQTINILTRRHGKKDFTIFANKSIQNLVAQISGAFSIFLVAIAAISLLVGGIGIMNIMLVSVTERTKEVGLRKAIGASDRAILTQFLIEAIFVSVIGGLIGTGVAVSGIFAVSLLTPLEAIVPLGAIVVATTVSASIGLVFGVVPAQKAARLDPITALKST